MNDPRTVIGPLARFVEDLALALPIIAGEDWRDPSVVPLPLGDWRGVQPADLRVAWYTHHVEAEPSAEVAAACRQAAEVLAVAGARVKEALPPRVDEVYDVTPALLAPARARAPRCLGNR